MSTQGAAAFGIWRETLTLLSTWYHRERRSPWFKWKALATFFAINLVCFWWAMFTAFHSKLHGMKIAEYGLDGFIVSFMGAVFGVVSLRFTFWAIGLALRARSDFKFLCFLCLDLVTPFIASWWVLLAFIFSGWVVAHILPIQETLVERAELYEDRIAGVVVNPLAKASLKNVYVGAIMGVSAMIPTTTQVLIALWSFLRGGRARAAEAAR